MGGAEEHQPLRVVGGDEPGDLEAREREELRQRDEQPIGWHDVEVQVGPRSARASLQPVPEERRRDERARNRGAEREPSDMANAARVEGDRRKGRQQRPRHVDLHDPRDALRPSPETLHAASATPIDRAGTASKKPMKKMMAAGSTYEGLLTCVENCSVHGAVRNHPQTSQRGSDGSRRQTYHASAQSAANESRFRKTNGASGMGAILSGTPTSSGCSAPEIALCVQTTSGPKIRPLARGVVS